MTDEPFGALAPPAFAADLALQQIKRSLRDLKLTERTNSFGLRGKTVVELQMKEGVLTARLARTLAMTPQWDTLTVASTGAQRKLLDDVKKRLARWDQED